jgi:Major Facilitator Superfamily
MISFGRAPCDEGVIRAAAETPGCADSAKPWVLAATTLGSSMAFIDSSAVNVALPLIQSDLNVSVQGAQWIVNGYMLMVGALILVGGSAGDRFGRSRVFALGAAIFTAASIGCGLAPSVTVLIAARVVQGLGGALLISGSLALISATFPAEERGKAIGTWAGFSAVTAALGPVLGGWLVDALLCVRAAHISVRLASRPLGRPPPKSERYMAQLLRCGLEPMDCTERSCPAPEGSSEAPLSRNRGTAAQECRGRSSRSPVQGLSRLSR